MPFFQGIEFAVYLILFVKTLKPSVKNTDRISAWLVNYFTVTREVDFTA